VERGGGGFTGATQPAAGRMQPDAAIEWVLPSAPEPPATDHSRRDPMRTFALHMRYNSAMTPRKTSTLNLRIDPALKEAARTAALREHRSIANLVEWLIRQHCEAAGIPIQEQSDLFQEPVGE
jgi:hypothetical protein